MGLSLVRGSSAGGHVMGLSTGVLGQGLTYRSR